MAWNFTFQGVKEDAIAAVNKLSATTGPGHIDHVNRAKACILTELQAMNPGTVRVSAQGVFLSNPPLPKSEIYIMVENVQVVNGVVLSPPNPVITGS